MVPHEFNARVFAKQIADRNPINRAITHVDSIELSGREVHTSIRYAAAVPGDLEVLCEAVSKAQKDQATQCEQLSFDIHRPFLFSKSWSVDGTLCNLEVPQTCHNCQPNRTFSRHF
jgi:hypothetical protein